MLDMPKKFRGIPNPVNGIQVNFGKNSSGAISKFQPASRPNLGEGNVEKMFTVCAAKTPTRNCFAINAVSIVDIPTHKHRLQFQYIMHAWQYGMTWHISLTKIVF